MSAETPIPEKPVPRNPLIQTALIRGLARLIFGLTGWKAVGVPPAGVPKYVMICAPHTSYWDGFWIPEKIRKFILNDRLRQAAELH